MQMSVHQFIRQTIKNDHKAQRTVKRSRKIEAETAIYVVKEAFLNRPLPNHIDYKAAIVKVVGRILKNTDYDHHDLSDALTEFFRQENNDRKHSNPYS